MANSYDRGDLVRLRAEFKNAAGTLTNPTAVVLRVKDPAGAVTTPVTTTGAAGVYEHDLSLTLEGTWIYRFEGTGAVQAAEEGEVYVRNSAFYES